MSPAKSLLFATLWSGLGPLCAPASATENEPVGDSRTEIVVTAQRRPERPQDVPISLTAMSGAELDRMQATETTDLRGV